MLDAPPSALLPIRSFICLRRAAPLGGRAGPQRPLCDGASGSSSGLSGPAPREVSCGDGRPARVWASRGLSLVQAGGGRQHPHSHQGFLEGPASQEKRTL